MTKPRAGRTRFQQRFVAFVDILGFRSLVDRMDEEPKLFMTIRDTLRRLDQQSRDFRNYRSTLSRKRRQIIQGGTAPLFWDVDLQMTAFSDSYVLSGTSPAWHVLAAVQALGSYLLEDGILTRGAVVRGPAYHRGRVLFGPAVIEAYDLETRVAKYPRILVTDAVRGAAWGYHDGLCRGRLFLRDVDGCWFVNVLAPPLSKWGAVSNATIGEDSRTFLRRVRRSLSAQLCCARGKIEHMSKVLWMVHNFNVTATQEGVEPIECSDTVSA